MFYLWNILRLVLFGVALLIFIRLIQTAPYWALSVGLIATALAVILWGRAERARLRYEREPVRRAPPGARREVREERVISPRWIFLSLLTLLLLFGSFYILLSHPDAPWILKGAQYPQAVTNVAAGAIGSILTFWFVPQG
jgi:hypothetical protein